MKVGFLGLGKLGLPCALAMELRGHEVMGFDPSWQVLETLKTKKLPYKEQGAQELLTHSELGVGTLEELVEFSEIIFIAIQTPHEPEYGGETRLPADRKDFDYSHLVRGVRDLDVEISAQEVTRTVVIISTVLPGTIYREIGPHLGDGVELCYNPYFIAMGTTIPDFLDPEFILLGGEPGPREKVAEFYRTITDAVVYETTIPHAELIKVAYNTFITMKVVFANTIMELCHRLGLDCDEITGALALSHRRLMSPAYLSGGMGDGGGCHPRDNIALSWLSSKCGLSFNFFEHLMEGREKQTEFLANLIEEELMRVRKNTPGKPQPLEKLPIVILGKSFKPETNLTAGSPALLLRAILEERGHKVEMYDPHIDTGPRPTKRALYFIATAHRAFRDYEFCNGSVVLDPWGLMESRTDVVRIGRH